MPVWASRAGRGRAALGHTADDLDDAFDNDDRGGDADAPSNSPRPCRTRVELAGPCPICRTHSSFLKVIYAEVISPGRTTVVLLASSCSLKMTVLLPRSNARSASRVHARSSPWSAATWSASPVAARMSS